MDEEKMINKYKQSFFKGLVQGVAYGIGLGIFSLFWNKYFRKAIVGYFKIPVHSSN
ncbi:hypothetical protein RB653_000673 [Dictyostelium firmibasis]|uniref:Uncharacterized protein n=1 Tax=Dictyostelium firmibasis TaxID=79012 RepID=A0AAN7U799_9MYCE